MGTPHMRLFLKILPLTLCFAILMVSAASAASFAGKVVRVIDGDTIEVLLEKKPVRIRLADIDCPEQGQLFGQAAKKFVLERAAHKIVTVHPRTKDRYGRTIAEVVLPDGESLNQMLLRHGFAWHYKKYSDDKALAELEDQARNDKVGLWQDNDPTPPWEWRRQKRQ